MRYLISGMLIITSVIHLLPLSGVLGSERLMMLYGIPFDEPNLVILMRHRAVLFGLVGVLLMYAAFRPAYQLLAFIVGFVSVISFLWIAWSVGGYNAQIARVFTADVIALVCLIVGISVHLFEINRRGNQSNHEQTSK